MSETTIAVNDFKNRIKAIKQLAKNGNHADAHADAVELYVDALRVIALGLAENPRELAKAVLAVRRGLKESTNA